MKKITYGAIIALLCFVSSSSFAQAFDKKTILISLGLGFNSDPMPGSTYDASTHRTDITMSSPLGQFNAKAEFAISKYWGIGVLGSLSGGPDHSYNSNAQGYMLHAEAGSFANFHFYQMIADKTGRAKKMHADKVDLYVGGGIGFRYQMYFEPGLIERTPLPYAEFHMGVRYQISQRVGVFGEIGLGQSMFSTGVAFKLGMPQKAKKIKEF